MVPRTFALFGGRRQRYRYPTRLLQHRLCRRHERRNCFPSGQERADPVFQRRPSRAQTGSLEFALGQDRHLHLLQLELHTRDRPSWWEQGAQLLIVPTMDVEEWGRHQHELHARVAPVRAAEYGIPIFRLASSGISQAVTGGGHVIAQNLFSRQRGHSLGATPVADAGSHSRWTDLLAPVCVGITSLVLLTLLVLDWQDKRARTKS